MHQRRSNLNKKQKTEQILKVWKGVNPVKGEKDSFLPDLAKNNFSAFSAGPLYYYIFNFFDLKIDYVHPDIQKILNISPLDFSIEKYLERIHPDDIDQVQLKEELAIQFLLEQIPPEKIPYYKVSYISRLAAGKNTYKTLLHQTIPLSVTDDNKIGHIMVVHTDITYLNVPVDSKISFIGMRDEPCWFGLDPENPDFSRKNFAHIFSGRELEILSYIARGKSSAEIAEQLYISTATVITHRKNILSKTDCRNTTELIAKCTRAGLFTGNSQYLIL